MMAKPRFAIALILSLVLSAAVCREAAAAVFLLGGGGRVEGELVNPKQVPRQTYVIRTPGGGQITLRRSQVKQILRFPPGTLEYELIRPSYDDTVEAQWALAEWCRERRLLKQRKTHLQRVIQLDPDHARARAVMGFRRKDGRWIASDALMQQRGLVHTLHGWQLPQEVAMEQADKQTAEAQAGWTRKVNMWRKWLGGKRDGEARGNLLAIADPFAAKVLIAALKDDDRPHERALYIEALAQIGTPEAVKALTLCSLQDPVSEVRLTCLDYLQKAQDPGVVTYFVRELRSKDNIMVNRAAIALRHLKNPAAVGPLIDALVTTHKYKIIQGGSPGSISPTFGRGPGGGGGGLSMGGKPKIIERHIPNQAVLDALVTLTGMNFRFNEPAWKSWYVAQNRVDGFNLRRD